MNRRPQTTGWASLAMGLVRLTALVTAGLAWASGMPGGYLTDVWTADEGLPDSSVTSIAQTPDGYLWIGTYNGLARFDGMHFATFDPANTPALAHARVRTLAVDDQGALWINTFDGSMTSWRQGTFAREWTGDDGLDPDATLVSSGSNQVTFLLHRGVLRRRARSAPAATGWKDLFPTNRMVGALCVGDGAGTVWYRASDKHLWRVAGSEFEPLPPNSGLAGGRVDCMVKDAKGRLWVSTDKEIATWDGVCFQTVTPTNAEWPADLAFLSVAEDGRIWAGVDGRVREAMDRRWILEAEYSKNGLTGNLSRMRGLEDHHGGVWLYDYGLGLSHISSGGQMHQFGPPDGFPGERVNCFFEDREGNGWVGLDPGGLVRIRERRFQTMDTSAPNSAKAAKSVCQEANGTVWIGTLGDGLARWQEGSLTNLTVPGGKDKGFAFCVCPDAAGRLWISAGDEDLFVREHDGFKRVSPVVHGVKAILADWAGRVWIGTKSGLYFADNPSSNEFTLQDGIGRRVVRALSGDRLGRLWAGTDDGIIFEITGHDAVALHPTDIKASHAIWSLLAEDDGTVWAGTFRGGLLRLQNGKFTRFSLKEGLPDSIICQILPDGAGNLWLGSHQGIFRVAKSALFDFERGKIKSVPCTVFGRSDGLPSLECSGGFQPSAWRGQDGRLWFTTVKGAVSVKPEEIRPNLLPPPVVIEEVLIEGKSLDASAQAQEKPLPARTIYDYEKKTLQIPPGNHQIEFRYTGLSLVSSDRVRFRYRLKGADTDWVEAGARRSVQYNLLPAGNYEFAVKACNSDGIWNETGCTLSLKVLPYFYETFWFRSLAGLTAVGLIAGAVRFAATRRLRRKLEQLARQQAVERERARIAKDIHDDLGASLTLIAVMGDLAKQEMAVERIEKMASTAREAVKSLDEIVWAVNPRNDTLAHLIDYMGQFAANYLRAAGVRCLLDVPEQAPRRDVPATVRHNVFLVVKEGLQNVVKHAGATEVWLRINATQSGLRIVLEDNGGGFDRVPEDALADGFRNMHQRMKEVGGQCQIQSRAGLGTQIIVELSWSTV